MWPPRSACRARISCRLTKSWTRKKNNNSATNAASDGCTGATGRGTILSFPRWSARSAARGQPGGRPPGAPQQPQVLPEGATAGRSSGRAANPGIERRRAENELSEPRRPNMSVRVYANTLNVKELIQCRERRV